MSSHCKKHCHEPQVTQRNSPNNLENVDEDGVLTKKMEELSCEEREQGLYELHGVSDIVKETNELLTLKLSELDFELENVPSAPALKLAIRLSLDFVKKMRIFFLRAEQFDTKRAARRMVRFFELKRLAFGDEKLVKDIDWSDLSDADHYCLKQGAMQILPQRDRAGRAILWWVGKMFYEQDDGTMLRLMYFMIMKMLEDEEVSKQGVVFVMYSIDQSRHHGYRPSIGVSLFDSTLPLRFAAVHFCYDQPQLKALLKVVVFAVGNYSLCRFRSHFGSHLECQYALMTFGIPKHLMPVTPDGELNLSYHKEWIEMVSKGGATSAIIKDGKESTSIAVKRCVPGPMDVLLGRGRHGDYSAGNLRFRSLLDMYRDIHEASETDERRLINCKIHDSMKASGSRFVKLGNEGWEEIPENVILEKIAHAFRNLRSNQNISKNRQDKRGREW